MKTVTWMILVITWLARPAGQLPEPRSLAVWGSEQQDVLVTDGRDLAAVWGVESTAVAAVWGVESTAVAAVWGVESTATAAVWGVESTAVAAVWGVESTATAAVWGVERSAGPASLVRDAVAPSAIGGLRGVASPRLC